MHPNAYQACRTLRTSIACTKTRADSTWSSDWWSLTTRGLLLGIEIWRPCTLPKPSCFLWEWTIRSIHWETLEPAGFGKPERHTREMTFKTIFYRGFAKTLVHSGWSLHFYASTNNPLVFGNLGRAPKHRKSLTRTVGLMVTPSKVTGVTLSKEQMAWVSWRFPPGGTPKHDPRWTVHLFVGWFDDLL